MRGFCPFGNNWLCKSNFDYKSSTTLSDLHAIAVCKQSKPGFSVTPHSLAGFCNFKEFSKLKSSPTILSWFSAAALINKL